MLYAFLSHQHVDAISVQAFSWLQQHCRTSAAFVVSPLKAVSCWSGPRLFTIIHNFLDLPWLFRVIGVSTCRPERRWQFRGWHVMTPCYIVKFSVEFWLSQARTFHWSPKCIFRYLFVIFLHNFGFLYILRERWAMRIYKIIYTHLIYKYNQRPGAYLASPLP